MKSEIDRSILDHKRGQVITNAPIPSCEQLTEKLKHLIQNPEEGLFKLKEVPPHTSYFGTDREYYNTKCKSFVNLVFEVNRSKHLAIEFHKTFDGNFGNTNTVLCSTDKNSNYVYMFGCS